MASRFATYPVQNDRQMSRQTRRTFLCVVVTALTVATGCTSRTETCTIMQPQIDQPHRVILTTSGQSSIHVNCPVPAAQEITVDGDAYSLNVILTPSQDPSILLGVAPPRSERYEVRGKALLQVSPQSSYRDRTTHYARLRDLRDGVVEFQVVDRMTQRATAYVWRIGTAQCTCRYYDGP